ncbi:MAG: DUF4307 domain-containing protein [Marmoricola sp.]
MDNPPPTDADATGALMRERYGTGRTPRWPLWGGLVIALAGLCWLVWAVALQSDPQVTSGLQSSEIGEHASTAVLQVRLASIDVHPTCLLRATATDHTVVGELHFTITDPPSTSFSVQRTIRTERRPTSIESIGCTAPGQQRPR